MKKKITFGTRVAYGCGDTACNIVYGKIGRASCRERVSNEV